MRSKKQEARQSQSQCYVEGVSWTEAFH